MTQGDQIWSTYHPVQARNNFGPKSSLSLAKLYMNVYISTVGSATPRINKGWPPKIEWMMPHIAVDDNVWTVVRIQSAVHFDTQFLIAFISKASSKKKMQLLLILLLFFPIFSVKLLTNSNGRFIWITKVIGKFKEWIFSRGEC